MNPRGLVLHGPSPLWATRLTTGVLPLKGSQKSPLSQAPKRGARPRGDFPLSIIPPHPQKKIIIRNTGADFSTTGLLDYQIIPVRRCAINGRREELGAPEGHVLNDFFNRPKPVACGFPRELPNQGRALPGYYPFLANPVLPISYQSYPLPA